MLADGFGPSAATLAREVKAAAAGRAKTKRTSHATRHTSHVTRHTLHVTRHTSHVTRHTSHVTRHTSHVTRHTSHVTRHTPHITRFASGRTDGDAALSLDSRIQGTIQTRSSDSALNPHTHLIIRSMTHHLQQTSSPTLPPAQRRMPVPSEHSTGLSGSQGRMPVSLPLVRARDKYARLVPMLTFHSISCYPAGNSQGGGL